MNDYSGMFEGFGGAGSFEIVHHKKSRGAGASGRALALSNTAMLDSASVADTVGTLSVLGGSGVYTFSLTSNPGGLFSITGSTLKVAASLSVANDPITVHADNGAGSIVDQAFTIVVSSASIPSEPFPIIF